jgi:hypothetical protein
MHPAYVSASAQTGQQEEDPMNFVKTLTVGALLASTLVATDALAKGHSQGRNQAGGMVTEPGVNVGMETVINAQNLGARRRSENAPVKLERMEAAGRSGDAGRPVPDMDGMDH